MGSYLSNAEEAGDEHTESKKLLLHGRAYVRNMG